MHHHHIWHVLSRPKSRCLSAMPGYGINAGAYNMQSAEQSCNNVEPMSPPTFLEVNPAWHSVSQTTSIVSNSLPETQ